ncbi:MAG TPA: phenylacetate--CoA ligase, partial [Desulfovibrio sp.]|nr:phenylacetate--CoA ligase [Desulfovibrio sp.]
MHYREAESEGLGRKARQWKALRSLLERALEDSGEFRERLRAAGLSARDLDSPEGLAQGP